MRQLFTDGWSFKKFPPQTDYESAAACIEEFRDVEVPHDWLIYDTHNFYESASGWYRKEFFCDKKDGMCYIIRFEGVYMDSEIYVNGTKVSEWKYGYSTFDVDVTERLVRGVNDIMVGVHYLAPNSRWYSGAGIYRNVWFLTLDESHFVPDGIYVSVKETEDGYNVCVTAEARLAAGYYAADKDNSGVGMKADGAGMEDDGARIVHRSGDGERFFLRCVLDGQEKEVPFESGVSTDVSDKNVTVADVSDKSAVGADAAGSRVPVAIATATLTFELKDVRRWDIDNPFMYEMRCALCLGDTVCDEENVRFGCRTVEVYPDKGLFLNHRHIKLKGVCMHHDLGALGSAVHRDAIRRQLRIMKEMGANAVRTSHNMPAVELMELADEMGILIVSEAFDCWERHKTEHDYAGFFDEWWKKDVASWIRRDRNHPSVIMWSIGNEIYDMHADARGQEVTRFLMEEVQHHDPDGNGLVTFGSNYMPWENAQKCADIVKIPGYNYAEKYYAEHHEAHPDWVIYGSETASTVQSRGIYHFPLSQSVLADVDEQCSALGNSTTSWGAVNSEACVIAERDHPYSLGQFLWSGFDYIGEPTPYHTKNSYFGQVDTAGFAKDSYYIFQSAWTSYLKKPMLHLYPYWDFNKGQAVDVRVCTNALWVELFVNGRMVGKKRIDHAHGDRLTADYVVPYEKGVITAKAYDENGREVAAESRYSFGDTAALSVKITDCEGNEVSCKADGFGRYTIAVQGGTRRLLFAEIGALDKDGRPVENANDRVSVAVSGAGRLMGLDNGDSTDYEQYVSDNRRLFSGKLLAILETSETEGMMDVFIARPKTDVPWIRKIELIRDGSWQLDGDTPSADITVRVYPPEAAKNDVTYEIITNAGIVTDIARITDNGGVTDEERAEGIIARLSVMATGDGQFRFRALATNGAKQVRVMSTLDFTAEGIGQMYFNPYRFIAGGLYNDSIGEPGNGNDFGVATGRGTRTVVGFKGVDFGETGSDCITLPIFELSGAYTPVGIWLGRPGEEGSSLIYTAGYHKTPIWNTYQEETYRLPWRLTGICDIYFELNDKIHLKGFVFKEYEKAYEQLNANRNQRVYGDSLRVTDEGIMDIGNNVTVEFDDMDFGDEGCNSIKIYGRTPNAANTIHIRFADEDGEMRQAVEFAGTEDYSEQTFALENVHGKKKVSFVFLPGSCFDFIWFRFCKERGNMEKCAKENTLPY